jgi:hypothetical protein
VNLLGFILRPQALVNACSSNVKSLLPFLLPLLMSVKQLSGKSFSDMDRPWGRNHLTFIFSLSETSWMPGYWDARKKTFIPRTYKIGAAYQSYPGGCDRYLRTFRTNYSSQKCIRRCSEAFGSWTRTRRTVCDLSLYDRIFLLIVIWSQTWKKW